MTINTTTKTVRITKAMQFAKLKAIPAVAADPELVKFIDHELELLSKKNTTDRKPTKAQTENAALKLSIATYLREQTEGVTASQVMTALSLTSNQKATALLNAMVAEGTATKATVKGKSLFSYANPNVEIVEGE